MFRNLFLTASLAMASGTFVFGEDLGDKLPEVELVGFSQTGAQSFEEYKGRAVLIEFFAYW
jgi:hypothetical protein